MKFINRFFRSNSKKPDQSLGCVSWLCAGKNKNDCLGQPCDSNHSSMLNSRSISMCSKPASQIKTNLKDLELHSLTVKMEYSNQQTFLDFINDQELIGVIGEDKKALTHLKSSCFQVRIGKNEELQTISSLRPFSFSKIVVFFNDFGSQIQISELVAASQHLILVIEGEDNLKTLMIAWDQQMLARFGDLPIQKSLHKIKCEVRKLEGKYWVNFKAQSVDSLVLGVRESLCNVQSSIASEAVSFLGKRLPLKQLLALNKEPSKQCYKNTLQNYLKGFLQESQRQQSTKDSSQEAAPLPGKSPQAVSQQIEQLSEDMQFEKSSNSEKYALYYLQRQNISKDDKGQVQGDPINEGTPHQMQDIFHFIESVETQNELSIEQRENKRASEEAFRSRNRSRSEDVNYETQLCMDMDDELFDKY